MKTVPSGAITGPAPTWSSPTGTIREGRTAGAELDVSTLADWVGACSATLAPLVELIRRHVLAADRIHGDDTTVPVLAKNKTVTGRLWTYVRDDRRAAAAIRRPPCSSTRVTGVASIRAGISRAGSVSCR